MGHASILSSNNTTLMPANDLFHALEQLAASPRTRTSPTPPPRRARPQTLTRTASVDALPKTNKNLPYSPFNNNASGCPTDMDRSLMAEPTPISFSTGKDLFKRTHTRRYELLDDEDGFVMYTKKPDETVEPSGADLSSSNISACRTARDPYGFKRPTQYVRIEEIISFDWTYQQILQRQLDAWHKFMQEHDNTFPTINSKLKRNVRKGVPPEYRSKVWLHYSGAEEKMKAHPGLYDKLVTEAFATKHKNEHAEAIRRDLHRTFPDNKYFCCAIHQADGSVVMDPETNTMLQALYRVLLAFSIHTPCIGYCQSLNFLAGFFLLIIKESEEAAFWMLETVVNDYYPDKMFDTTMEGSSIDQMVLMQFVYEKMPGVWNKIGNKRCFWECTEQSDRLPPITLVTNHWFLTLFINIMPVETVLRVWDCVFVEGYKVLFRVALTIIKMNEKAICAVDDPTEVFQILQNMPRRLIDAHDFLDRVFSRNSLFGDVTRQEVERRRAIFMNRTKSCRASASTPDLRRQKMLMEKARAMEPRVSS